IPDPPAEHLYNNWKSLIPTLVEPYLRYTSRTLGKPLLASPTSISLCNHAICTWKPTKLLCLLSDRKFLYFV
ncbi:hypothetical protein HYDPIDRAFT_51614, partial [Hydnomerulius pinastri MD-312]